MKKFWILMALAMVALLALWGCSNDTSNDPVDPGDGGGTTDKTCLGCHSSEEMLKAALGDTSGSKVLIGDKGDG
jgi:ABC-type glycerol-3-phosphate transport system substrate-binding protein